MEGADFDTRKRKRENDLEMERALAFSALRLALSIKRDELRLAKTTIDTAMDAIECHPALLVKDYSVSMDLWSFYKALEENGVDKGNQDFALISAHARRVAGDYHSPCEKHEYWIQYQRDRLVGSIHSSGWRISPAVAIVCGETTQEVAKKIMSNCYDRPEHIAGVGCVDYPDSLRPVSYPVSCEWTFDGVGEVILHGAMETIYGEERGWRVWDDSSGPSFAYGPRVRDDFPSDKEKASRAAEEEIFAARVDSVADERPAKRGGTCGIHRKTKHRVRAGDVDMGDATEPPGDFPRGGTTGFGCRRDAWRRGGWQKT
eukprot:jgi/Mesvir1/22184/Mv18786-RA.1